MRPDVPGESPRLFPRPCRRAATCRRVPDPPAAPGRRHPGRVRGPVLRRRLRLVLMCGWRPVVEGVRHLLRSRDDVRWARWLAVPAGQVAAGWQEYARGVLLPRYVRYLVRARPALARCLALLERFPPRPGP